MKTQESSKAGRPPKGQNKRSYKITVSFNEDEILMMRHKARKTGMSLDEVLQQRTESENRGGDTASHSESISAAIGILTSGFYDTAPSVDDYERQGKKKRRGMHR